MNNNKRLNKLKAKLKNPSYIRRRLQAGDFVYTDYPFRELGDTPGEKAPVRRVMFISWDGDKYCVVKYGEISLELKAWYLNRCRDLSSPIRDYDLPILTLEKSPIRIISCDGIYYIDAETRN